MVRGWTKIGIKNHIVHTKFMLTTALIGGGIILALLSYANHSDTRLPAVMSSRSEALYGGVIKTNKHFIDQFEREETIEEVGAMEKSGSAYWWVNSGGRLEVQNGQAHTIQGESATDSLWYQAYAAYNPGSTDGGMHPQNIFRLVTRSQWRNLRQEAYFKINKHNFSKDEHRNASNGLLLFNRYIDGDNLYYTGIRVDGAAVIKKKINGIYYTLAYQPVIQSEKYNRNTNPTLLSEGTWLGLRSEVTDNPDGTVIIKLYLDRDGKDEWKLVAIAKDDGKKYGGEAIIHKGYAGIRTDFMDASIKDYSVRGI